MVEVEDNDKDSNKKCLRRVGFARGSDLNSVGLEHT